MLKVGEVHLWLTWLNEEFTPELLAAYRGLLSNDEKQRQQGFLCPEDRRLFLVSHALVRTVLSKYVRRTPHDWEFDTGSFAKPFIRKQSEEDALYFNLSHSHGLAAVGVAREQDIGVDVQKETERIKPVALAQRFFAPAEAEAIAGASLAEVSRIFHQYWTLKEAYLKAGGEGLRIALNSFSFTLEPQPTIVFNKERKDNPELWRFWHLNLKNNFQAAVALRTHNAKGSKLWIYETIPLKEEIRQKVKETE